jgi:hypothetical protein
VHNLGNKRVGQAALDYRLDFRRYPLNLVFYNFCSKFDQRAPKLISLKEGITSYISFALE